MSGIELKPTFLKTIWTLGLSILWALNKFWGQLAQLPVLFWPMQWRNRRGGRVPPRDFWPGNFCWRIGKKKARKKGKMGENWEEKVENWKWKQENVRKRGEDLFFFFFFFFCFSLLKTTKICFGSTKMGIFYREKAFHAGKKIRKNDFAPSEKYACYAPGPMCTISW